MKNKKNKRGFVLAVVLLLVLLGAVFIPVLTQLAQHESRAMVKNLASSRAFQLAESGVARGVSKVQSSAAMWSQAMAGTPISGYNNDVSYSDMEGGRYKIRVTSGASTSQIKIVAQGRDNVTGEVRAIEAVYRGTAPVSGGFPAVRLRDGIGSPSNTPSWDSLQDIHWGPVISHSGLQGYTKPQTYPRLYAAGPILSRTCPDADNCTDNTEYWGFREDLGSFPMPDFEYYKSRAQASTIPTQLGAPAAVFYRDTTNAGCFGPWAPGTLPVANPPGSGYFTGGGTYYFRPNITFDWPNAYVIRSSTSVFYLEGNLGSVCYGFLELEAVIVRGRFTSNGGNPSHVFGATIPVNAAQEYSAGAALAHWNANFSGVGAGNCCVNIRRPDIHGFVYADVVRLENHMASWHMAAVVGAVHSPLGENRVNGVYLDDQVAQTAVLQLTTTELDRVSWREVKPSW